MHPPDFRLPASVRPVLLDAATTMDEIFPLDERRDDDHDAA